LDLIFQKGSKESPKGHALLYFTNKDNPSEIWGTYIITLPIQVDIKKYMPPFLLNDSNSLNSSDFNSFAFPPSPELIGPIEIVQDLAEVRDEDLIDGGNIDINDSANNMMKINEILSQYLNLYLNNNAKKIEEIDENESENSNVNSLMYEFMNVNDRMTELSKLLSKLLFAIENSQDTLITECEKDIESLSTFYPENHKINKIVEYTKIKNKSKIAELYFKRCLYLAKENYGKVEECEKLIEQQEI